MRCVYYEVIINLPNAHRRLEIFISIVCVCLYKKEEFNFLLVLLLIGTILL